MTIQAPDLTIMQLLEDNWDPANTHNITPDFNTGWDDDAQYPAVVVHDPDENPMAGGTGFDGIDGGGAGPVKTLIGFVDVDCFVLNDPSDSVDAQDLVDAFSQEVHRIVKANRLNATDLDWISHFGRNKNPLGDMPPTVERHLVRVKYSYQDRP